MALIAKEVEEKTRCPAWLARTKAELEPPATAALPHGSLEKEQEGRRARLRRAAAAPIAPCWSLLESIE